MSDSKKLKPNLGCEETKVEEGDKSVAEVTEKANKPCETKAGEEGNKSVSKVTEESKPILEKEADEKSKEEIPCQQNDENAKEGRLEKIAIAMKDLMLEGEMFFIQKEGEEIKIVPTNENKISLQETHPELYGHLLRVDEQIFHAGGCFTICLILMIAFFICISLHLHLPENLFGWYWAENFRSGWLYAFVMLFFSWCAFLISELREKRAYKKGRKDIRDAIAKSKITFSKLISQIEGDVRLEKVDEYLKLDTALDLCQEGEKKEENKNKEK